MKLHKCFISILCMTICITMLHGDVFAKQKYTKEMYDNQLLPVNRHTRRILFVTGINEIYWRGSNNAGAVFIAGINTMRWGKYKAYNTHNDTHEYVKGFKNLLSVAELYPSFMYYDHNDDILLFALLREIDDIFYVAMGNNVTWKFTVMNVSTGKIIGEKYVDRNNTSAKEAGREMSKWILKDVLPILYKSPKTSLLEVAKSCNKYDEKTGKANKKAVVICERILNTPYHSERTGGSYDKEYAKSALESIKNRYISLAKELVKLRKYGVAKAKYIELAEVFKDYDEVLYKEILAKADEVDKKREEDEKIEDIEDKRRQEAYIASAEPGKRKVKQRPIQNKTRKREVKSYVLDTKKEFTHDIKAMVQEYLEIHKQDDSSAGLLDIIFGGIAGPTKKDSLKNYLKYGETSNIFVNYGKVVIGIQRTSSDILDDPNIRLEFFNFGNATILGIRGFIQFVNMFEEKSRVIHFECREKLEPIFVEVKKHYNENTGEEEHEILETDFHNITDAISFLTTFKLGDFKQGGDKPTFKILWGKELKIVEFK